MTPSGPCSSLSVTSWVWRPPAEEAGIARAGSRDCEVASLIDRVNVRFGRGQVALLRRAA